MEIRTIWMGRSTLRKEGWCTRLAYHRYRSVEHSRIDFFILQRLREQVISTIERFQGSPYDIEKEEPAYSMLCDLPVVNEEVLFQTSLRREPRKIELKELQLL
jgi:hypothetical protein